MNHIATGLLLAVFAAVPLHAQGNGMAEAPEHKGRLAWFVYTSMPEGLENPVSVMAGKDISQVLLSRLSPSAPVKVPGDGILRIVRKIDNPNDPDKPAYLTLAQAAVPETVRAAMVILIPAAKNKDGLLFNAKVQDLAAMNGGDTMFLNMTDLRIGIELGKEKFIVTPGQGKIHNPLGNQKSASLPIRISYFHPDRGEWDMITASTVALYSTRREIRIFSVDCKLGRISYHRITFPVD